MKQHAHVHRDDLPAGVNSLREKSVENRLPRYSQSSDEEAVQKLKERAEKMPSIVPYQEAEV